jgi:hypothetical protein
MQLVVVHHEFLGHILGQKRTVPLLAARDTMVFLDGITHVPHNTGATHMVTTMNTRDPLSIRDIKIVRANTTTQQVVVIANNIVITTVLINFCDTVTVTVTVTVTKHCNDIHCKTPLFLYCNDIYFYGVFF